MWGGGGGAYKMGGGVGWTYPYKKWDRKNCPIPLKGGTPASSTGVQNVSDPQFSHFVVPPPPIVSDRSLKERIDSIGVSGHTELLSFLTMTGWI